MLQTIYCIVTTTTRKDRRTMGSQNKTVLTRSCITSSKSHSNVGIYPKICLFWSSVRRKVKGKEQKLINTENSEFQEKVTQYTTWLQDQPMLTKINAVDLISKDTFHDTARIPYQMRNVPMTNTTAMH